MGTPFLNTRESTQQIKKHLKPNPGQPKPAPKGKKAPVKEPAFLGIRGMK